MIFLKNTDVWGFEHAIRGMRNPMNSWKKSDSGYEYGCNRITCEMCEDKEYCKSQLIEPDAVYVTGQNDLDLMKRLSKAGTDHRKFLRQIFVSVDITAPLYWWKEADTYKVGTVANSCSTMHKIHDKEFTLDDFSCEHLIDYVTEEDKFCVWYNEEYINSAKDVLEFTIEALNKYRYCYLETKDKKYWWQMIQLLPSSYNQMRTVTLNYEVLINQYFARRNHKLDEWHTYCEWIESLPYMKELIKVLEE